MRLKAVLFCFLFFTGCFAINTNDKSLKEIDSIVEVQNFAFYGRDRERVSERIFLDSSAFQGAQLTYAWKELEPSNGVYDFSTIERDLRLLSEHRKKLFVQLQDSTFNPSKFAVPAFLKSDPQFNGGVVYQYDKSGVPEGLVAMRWHPAVRTQFQRLLKALGQAFDGRIAGINLQETSVDIEETSPNNAGFTYAGYRDAILDNMKALKAAFPNSISMQYANFMPGEKLPSDDKGFLRSVYEYGNKINIAVGAPDLMPQRVNQQNHAYRFMAQFKDSMILGVAVQDGNYTGTTGNESAGNLDPNAVRSLDHFAHKILGVQFIFWGAQEPYFSRDVIPYLMRSKFVVPSGAAPEGRLLQ